MENIENNQTTPIENTADEKEETDKKNIPVKINRYVVFAGLFLILLALPIFIQLNNQTSKLPINAASTADFNLYDNQLASGWVDWSFDATRNFAYIDDTATQNKVIAITLTRQYGGLYIHSNLGLNPRLYDTVQFSIKGTQAGQKFGVLLNTVGDKRIGQEVLLANAGGNPQPGVWTNYSIPLNRFSAGNTKTIGGFIIQDELGLAKQTYYVDNIRFINSISSATPTPTSVAVPTTMPPSATPSSLPITSVVPSGITPTTTGRVYPWHTNIVSTTFWVGEIFNASLADGSQVCSTYDSSWAYHWSGINKGTIPANATACPGSIYGGCDGIAGANNSCATEKRTAANGYFPTHATPKENPFYLDLPFDDINDSTAYNQRCQVIPWANDPGYSGHCKDTNFSYMKNRWVRIVGPNGNTCYGQIEDAGPSHGSLYHDAAYVFGSNDVQPIQGQFNNAGADVSPALNGCLGFAELDGQNDKIKWQFVDDASVPSGPWKQVVTTSQVQQ